MSVFSESLSRRAFAKAATVVSAGTVLGRGASPAAHAQAEFPLQPASADSALQAMLALVPTTFAELEDPEQAFIAYADIAAQLDAVGVTPPDRMDDDAFGQWSAVTLGLPFPSFAAQFLEFWREDYGFDLLQADQTLSISLPPFDLSLYRGRFDEREITRALRELGYTPVAHDRSILAIRGDYEHDVRAPTAYRFAAMNYATIFGDGTLAFASAQGILEAVLDTSTGGQPSLAERDDIAPLLATVPDDLASALFVHGLMLTGNLPPELLDPESQGTPDIDAIATEMADQRNMPPVDMVLLGMTAGGPVDVDQESTPPASDTPAARGVVVALMGSPDAADIAAPIIEERLATGASTVTGQPYAEFFPRSTVEAVPQTPVVRIELALGDDTSPGILMQMLFRRDLGFLAW